LKNSLHSHGIWTSPVFVLVCRVFICCPVPTDLIHKVSELAGVIVLLALGVKLLVPATRLFSTSWALAAGLFRRALIKILSTGPILNAVYILEQLRWVTFVTGSILAALLKPFPLRGFRPVTLFLLGCCLFFVADFASFAVEFSGAHLRKNLLCVAMG
jgi:hypothetical protein